MKRFESDLTMGNIERIAVFLIEDVLPFVVKDKRDEGAIKVYAGYEVKMWSLRYHAFKKSISCVNCGITGRYFALERSVAQDTQRCHFNLYAKLADGTEVLLTKDHIVPKSKGGKDHIGNLQTMCKVCNEMKMDKESTGKPV
jgi:5-methylcytosine-specific restriction endonuclease McrA